MSSFETPVSGVAWTSGSDDEITDHIQAANAEPAAASLFPTVYPAGLFVPAAAGTGERYPRTPVMAEVWDLEIDGTGGTFTPTIDGAVMSAQAFDVDDAVLQTAAEALATVGAGNVTVVGGPGDDGGDTPYRFTFDFPLKATPTCADSLTGGAGTAVWSRVSHFGPTGEWNGGIHTGLAFDADSDEKGAMSLYARGDLPDPVVNIIGLAAGFGSGDVRFYHSSDPANFVVVEVAASYMGPLDFAVPVTWSSTDVDGVGALKFAQLALTRDADHVTDTLNQDFSVLAVYLTEG